MWAGRDRSPANPCFLFPRDCRGLLAFSSGLLERAQRHWAVRCWRRGRWWWSIVLPLPLFFLLTSLQVFLVPVVRPVTADNPDFKAVIKKGNTRKEKIIFKSLCEFDSTFRRKGISLAHVLSFYWIGKAYSYQEPEMNLQCEAHTNRKHQANQTLPLTHTTFFSIVAEPHLTPVPCSCNAHSVKGQWWQLWAHLFCANLKITGEFQRRI